MSSVEAAVRIAGALGVTVEYLVTGKKQQEPKNLPLAPDPRIILKNLESLNKRDRKIVVCLIDSLKGLEDDSSR
jgi:hypothetical protein